jgi:STE24 endopeptidase
MVVTRLWLASRQIRHVAAHRSRVPEQFENKISLEAHQKAADYTIARNRVGMLDVFLGAMVLLAFTLLGGLQVLLQVAQSLLPDSPLARQLLIIGLFTLVATAIDWPLDFYRQFTIEEHFGFNRMSKTLWLSDQIKGLALGAAIGLPLLAAVLWLMQNIENWWLWAWVLWVSFSLVMMVVGPMFILPIFNKLEPLADGPLKNRVVELMKRCEFEAGGLFVMDGSKRSAHGNAFFAGMGKGRRIVLFDTIIAQLNESEIEAVLAHELGHFKRKHIIKRIIPSMLLVLPAFWFINYLMHQTWFYQGLGVTVPLQKGDFEGMALVLFMLAMPIFLFFIEPLSGYFSRKHEFEADAFASQFSSRHELVSALVKMYQDNASTLTPDPIHSAFYDSHPPAAIRINALLKLQTNS